MSTVFDAAATAAALPYTALADAIEQLLHDDSVIVPPRLVQRLPGGGSLFVMPAVDAQVAITKLITFMPDNPASGRPSIQGDIVVFDSVQGQRIAVLDGPTVTARRTAAVSLVAARRLATSRDGPLLIVGAGVQGRAHLEAFHQGLGIGSVWIASRSAASAQALAALARARGLQANVVADPHAVLADCPLVVTCTPAQQVVLRGTPAPRTFLCAVGAFTPAMVEWAPEVCQHVAAHGRVVVDTRDADHEAGDLLQAGLDVTRMPTLSDVVRQGHASHASAPAMGPILFKSCGWAGWDLAAARCVLGLAS